MESGLKVSIDFLCSQFAVLMFAGLQDKRERGQKDYRLFVAMLFAIMLSLVADAARNLTDGSATRQGQALLRAAVALSYASSTIVPMMYAVYVEYLTFSPRRRPRAAGLLYAVPSAALACLSLASLSTGWFFAFDGAGAYRSGRFAYVNYLVFYGYLIYALALAFRRRKSMSSRDYASLVSFPVPMAVLGLAQSLMPEYLILLPSQVLSLLCLYSNIQERRLTYDYLTGAYNRRRLDEYLEAAVLEARASGRPWAAFLADVNDFKAINDRHGHKEGDAALVRVVELVKSSLRRDDFLARYAGDEFVAVLPDCDRAELELVVERIRLTFESASAPGAPYALSISVGAATFDPGLDPDADAFVKRLDALMYERKRARKAGRGAP